MLSYTPFPHIQGGIGKGLSRMSDAMIQQVYAKTEPLLLMLGYELVSPETKCGNMHHTDCSSSNNGNDRGSGGYSIKMNPLTINEHIQTAVNNHHNSHTTRPNLNATTSISTGSDSPAGVYINTSYSIRRSNDPFGRDFTLTRRRLTEDDKRPLPTVTP